MMNALFIKTDVNMIKYGCYIRMMLYVSIWCVSF